MCCFVLPLFAILPLFRAAQVHNVIISARLNQPACVSLRKGLAEAHDHPLLQRNDRSIRIGVACFLLNVKHSFLFSSCRWGVGLRSFPILRPLVGQLRVDFLAERVVRLPSSSLNLQRLFPFWCALPASGLQLDVLAHPHQLMNASQVNPLEHSLVDPRTLFCE